MYFNEGFSNSKYYILICNNNNNHTFSKGDVRLLDVWSPVGNNTASLLSYSMCLNVIAVVYSKYEHVIVIVIVIYLKQIYFCLCCTVQVFSKKLFAFKSAVTFSKQSYNERCHHLRLKTMQRCRSFNHKTLTHSLFVAV